MSYTAAEIKSFTSIAQVATWSTEKCEKYISLAESWVNKFQMDSSIEGYSTAYENAVLVAFDCLAENPTGRSSLTTGKRKVDFQKIGEDAIMRIIGSFVGDSPFQGVHLERDDIGTR